MHFNLTRILVCGNGAGDKSNRRFEFIARVNNADFVASTWIQLAVMHRDRRLVPPINMHAPRASPGRSRTKADEWRFEIARIPGVRHWPNKMRLVRRIAKVVVKSPRTRIRPMSDLINSAEDGRLVAEFSQFREALL